MARGHQIILQMQLNHFCVGTYVIYDYVRYFSIYKENAKYSYVRLLPQIVGLFIVGIGTKRHSYFFRCGIISLFEFLHREIWYKYVVVTYSICTERCAALFKMF